MTTALRYQTLHSTRRILRLGRIFSALSEWNQPISASAQVDADSARMVANLQGALVANGVNSFGDIQVAATSTKPLYYDGTNTPQRFTVTPDANNWFTAIPNVPFPYGATPSTGSDKWLVTVDLESMIGYEFWKLTGMTWPNPVPVASIGCSFDLNGLGYFTSGQHATANASGTSLLGGLIRYDDMKAGGAITHKLSFAYGPASAFAVAPYDTDPVGNRTDKYAQGVGADGITANLGSDAAGGAAKNTAGNIPNGAVIRIKSSVNLVTLAAGNARKLALLTCLRDYGAVCVDGAGVMTFYAAQGFSEVPNASWPSSVLTATDLHGITPSTDLEVMSLPTVLTVR